MVVQFQFLWFIAVPVPTLEKGFRFRLQTISSTVFSTTKNLYKLWFSMLELRSSTVSQKTGLSFLFVFDFCIPFILDTDSEPECISVPVPLGKLRSGSGSGSTPLHTKYTVVKNKNNWWNWSTTNISQSVIKILLYLTSWYTHNDCFFIFLSFHSLKSPHHSLEKKCSPALIWRPSRGAITRNQWKFYLEAGGPVEELHHVTNGGPTLKQGAQ